MDREALLERELCKRGKSSAPLRSRGTLPNASPMRCSLQIPQVQDKLKGEIADLQHGSAFGPVRAREGGHAVQLLIESLSLLACDAQHASCPSRPLDVRALPRRECSASA